MSQRGEPKSDDFRDAERSLARDMQAIEAARDRAFAQLFPRPRPALQLIDGGKDREDG